MPLSMPFLSLLKCGGILFILSKKEPDFCEMISVGFFFCWDKNGALDYKRNSPLLVINDRSFIKCFIFIFNITGRQIQRFLQSHLITWSFLPFTLGTSDTLQHNCTAITVTFNITGLQSKRSLQSHLVTWRYHPCIHHLLHQTCRPPPTLLLPYWMFDSILQAYRARDSTSPTW